MCVCAPLFSLKNICWLVLHLSTTVLTRSCNLRRPWGADRFPKLGKFTIIFGLFNKKIGQSAELLAWICGYTSFAAWVVLAGVKPCPRPSFDGDWTTLNTHWSDVCCPYLLSLHKNMYPFKIVGKTLSWRGTVLWNVLCFEVYMISHSNICGLSL